VQRRLLSGLHNHYLPVTLAGHAFRLLKNTKSIMATDQHR